MEILFGWQSPPCKMQREIWICTLQKRVSGSLSQNNSWFYHTQNCVWFSYMHLYAFPWKASIKECMALHTSILYCAWQAWLWCTKISLYAVPWILLCLLFRAKHEMCRHATHRHLCMIKYKGTYARYILLNFQWESPPFRTCSWIKFSSLYWQSDVIELILSCIKMASEQY